MLALLHLALRNLFLHRERGLLLFSVIAGSSALLVGMMALKTGVASAQREAVTTLLSGDVNVGGFFKAHPDAISPVLGDARPVRAVVEPLLPAGCQLRERGRGSATAKAGLQRTRSYLVGLDASRERDSLRLFKVKEGSLEALDEPRTVALSSQLAARLRVKVGDMTTLFTRTLGGKRNALDAEVVAITDRAGLMGETAGILVSNATLRELNGFRPEAVGVLQLTCGRDTDVDALASHLRESLRQAGFEVLPALHQAFDDKTGPLLREGWAGQRLDVTTWEDEGAFLSFVTDGLAALTVLVGLVVLAVVIVGLFVSLSVAVRERTREIGMLRAMGMQRPSVVGMFVLEGLLLGLTASTTGVCVAAALCKVLQGSVVLPEVVSSLFFSGTLPLELQPVEALFAVLLVTLAAGVASILPAARAAALAPRSAMESL
ncbi:ABC transporter permease [Vitiosangium sp. GDMCC 1.1324]|uniref:ABC transporter permease n=1 Tax=Vitiosangium sp. (strain GDMCC 1.1324) TaxID=2138576 RepID=UPI000D345D42|nr:ABC transporter permease [Vitiosangium sp. GDMCC 1.1324]PTL79268.1 permease [Vitiosangium sp. GDMCC 1.1324]